MRFELRTTSDGSLTVFDHEAGECFKSRHAARAECEHVFYRPGVLENPAYGTASPFRVLELGFGLGTNFLYLAEQGFRGELVSIDRDLSGAKFLLEHEAQPELAAFLSAGKAQLKEMQATLLEGDFFDVLPTLPPASFHAVFFDPFSPASNPEAWTARCFTLLAPLLAPGGRLVTYSVSRAAKDGASAAGLLIEKRDLPPLLQKRSALLATKPTPR